MFTKLEDVVFRNNVDEQRYEAHVGAELAGFAVYRLAPERVVFIHTEVEDQFEGRGVGVGLARFALDDARRLGLSVTPLCPFIAAFISKHPEYQNLLFRSTVGGLGTP